MKIEIDTEELTMMANSLMGRMGRDEEGWRDRLRIEAQARSAAEERLRDVQEELSGLRNFPLQARFDRCKEQLSLASKRADHAERRCEELQRVNREREDTVERLRGELEVARAERGIRSMTLIETLNNIHLVGGSTEITFTPHDDGEITPHDIDPDFARAEVVEFLIDMVTKIAHDHQENMHPSPPTCDRLKRLCIYGAALFAAIDAHGADALDCEEG